MTEDEATREITRAKIAENRAIDMPYGFTVPNWRTGEETQYIGLPGVFSPAIFTGTEYFANVIPVNKGDRIVEIGSGTGAVTVELLKRSGNYAIGVDINPQAVTNTRVNAELHGLHKHIQRCCTPKLVSYKASVKEFFRHLQHPFELAFWNMPFAHASSEPDDDLEKSVFIDYTTVGEYTRKALDWTSPNGRVFLGFSPDVGDRDHLDFIVEERPRRLEVVDERTMPRFHGQEEPTLTYQLLEVVRG